MEDLVLSVSGHWIDPDTPLTLSPFVQVVEDVDAAVMWHSLFGVPRIVSRATLDLLQDFHLPRSLNSLCETYQVGEDDRHQLDDLITNHYLIPQGIDERAVLADRLRKRERTITSGSLIDNLELIMSEACNFRCVYCIHFNNLETSDRLRTPPNTMSFAVAKEVVDGFLRILGRQGRRVTRGKVRKIAEINFGGGEALLAWPVVEQVLSYCRSTYSHDFEFRFSLNTNAALLSPAIARTLRSYGVEVALSLDGLGQANDRVRQTKSGRPTFEAIVSGFDTLAAEGYPAGGFAITVNEQNFFDIDERIVDWAADRQMHELRIDVDVIGMVDLTVAEVTKKLMRLRHYATRRCIDITGFWSRPAENLNDSTLEIHVAFCGAVRGNSMCVTPSGNIYSCGYSTTKLGTLVEIGSFHAAGGPYHCFVRDHPTGAMEMCRGCMIEGQCGGGCNITREYARAKNPAKIERMCEFYREMTRALILEQLHETHDAGREELPKGRR